jgi:alginate O-acetyltransferase complex protein AlgJ
MSSAFGSDRATTTMPFGCSSADAGSEKRAIAPMITARPNGEQANRLMMDIDRSLPIRRGSATGRRTFLATAFAAGASFACGPARAATSLIIDGKGDWLFPTWESLTDPGTAGIANTIATIAATDQTLRNGGIRLLVLVVPLKARLEADKLPDGVTISPAVEARYAAILAQLAAAKIPTFDVDAVLRSLTQPTFFRTDYHWTEWSAEAVAQACAEHVRALASLPPSPTALPPLGAWSQDEHEGDLASLLPPDRQKAIGEEAITIRAIDASREQLLDGSAARVHVVGNSFSMPYLGFPEMLAETLREPVGVSAKFGNAGPWETLVEYLESPSFATSRPRVIVWQFVEGLFMHGPAATGFWDVASLMSEQTFRERVAKAVGPGTGTPS